MMIMKTIEVKQLISSSQMVSFATKHQMVENSPRPVTKLPFTAADLMYVCTYIYIYIVFTS